MQAKQYEERIAKLQDALEMQKLKNTSQAGRIKLLEEQLQAAQSSLEEERKEKETILKNRQTNRLLLELQEERVQRLQDLQEIYAKDKQLEALTNEVSFVQQGVSEAQKAVNHKEAEVVGLRASLKVSTKLLQKSEKDFLDIHKELEATQLQLLDCRRRISDKETEVNEWIERYEQVMLDLHAAQLRLTQLSRDASSKDAALTRGYAICLAKSTPELGVLRPPTFSKLKNVGYSDRAVRKFRHDQIPNRAQALTSTSTIRAATRGIPQGTAQAAFAAVESGSQHISRSSSNNLNPHLMSRDCNVCTTSTSSLDIGFGHGKATSSLTRPRNDQRSESDSTSDLHGSKYLGYGLGLLKKNHIVPPEYKV